jgi:putative transposase
MSRTRRSFSASEKPSIINEADQLGITQALRKHNLSHSVFKRWKESFNEGGVSNLQSYSKQHNPDLDAIMQKNRMLKNIVAKQSIEL